MVLKHGGEKGNLEKIEHTEKILKDTETFSELWINILSPLRLTIEDSQMTTF